MHQRVFTKALQIPANQIFSLEIIWYSIFVKRKRGMENVDIWFRYRNERSLVLIIQSILRETEYAWSARAKWSYLWSKWTLFNLLKKQYQLCKNVYIQFLFFNHAHVNLFFFSRKKKCMHVYFIFLKRREKTKY